MGFLYKQLCNYTKTIIHLSMNIAWWLVYEDYDDRGT